MGRDGQPRCCGWRAVRLAAPAMAAVLAVCASHTSLPAQPPDAPRITFTELASPRHEVRLSFRVEQLTAAPRTTIPVAIPLTSFTTCTIDRVFTIAATDSDLLPSGTLEPRPAPSTYGVLTPIGHIRTVRIGRLVLPINHPDDPTRRIVSGEVRIAFEPGPEPPPAPGGTFHLRGPLLERVQATVVNPGALPRVAAPSPAEIPSAIAPAPWSPVGHYDAPVCLRLDAREDGLVAFTGADLRTSGVIIQRIDPATLRLLRDGQSLPLVTYPEGGAPAATIRPGDRFVFYARENDSPYTRTSAYWLVSDADIPVPEPAAPPDPAVTLTETAYSFPHTEVIEEDNRVLTQNDQFLSILGYRWVWTQLTSGTVERIGFDAPGLQALPVEARARLHTFNQALHPASGARIRVRINGGAWTEFSIPNDSHDRFAFGIPPGVLRDSGNVAEVELLDSVVPSPAPGMPAARNEIWLDRLEITYPRTYALAPGAAEIVFRSPAPGADADGASTQTRRVEYTITGVGDSPYLLLDTTHAEPVSIPFRLERGVRVGEGDRLRFARVEDGRREYRLIDTTAARAVGLHPVPAGRRPLAETAGAADYVIISYGPFLPELAEFIEYRRASGYNVAAADVAQVYDEYDAGHDTPMAIKRFLRDLTDRGSGTPARAPASFVLLVGDCTSAYRDDFREFANGVRNYVPSFTPAVAPSNTARFASDLYFVETHGTGPLADGFIGRISVNNTDDLRAVLDKIRGWRTQREPGPWRNTLGFVADHTEFDAPAQRMVARTPPSFFRRGVFTSREPWADNFYFPAEVAEAKRAKVSPVTTRKIRDLINTGASVLTYVGHGSPNIWSTERIWFGGDSENSDILMLTNRRRLPLIINFTCNSGAIDYPVPKWNICISEDFIRHSEGGAIACFVPSGPGTTTQHEAYMADIARVLLEDRVDPIGPALTEAGWRHLIARDHADLVRMFILLGDPALPLELPGVLSPDAATSEPLFAMREGTYVQAQALADTTYEEPILPVTSAAIAALPADRDAVVFDPADSGGRGTAEVWSRAPHQLKLDAVRHEPAGLIPAGSEATFRVRVRNSGATTSPAVRLLLRNIGGADIGESEPREIPPGAVAGFTAATTVLPGLTEVRFALAAEDYEHDFGAEKQTVLVARARQPEPEFPDILLVPAPADVTYRAQPDGSVTAVVRGRVASVSDGDVENLRVGFTNRDGLPLPATIINLGTIEPGQIRDFEVKRDYAAPPDEEELLLAANPEAPVPGVRTGPGLPVVLGKARFPDLVIAAPVVPSDTNPSDGQTLFFDVTVENRGRTATDGVDVEAYDTTTTPPLPLESRVLALRRTHRLEPRTSVTIRVRWDPFRNAGDRTLRFRALSRSGQPDRDPDNAVQDVALRVRTKYRLRRAGIEAVPDVANRRVRFTARVENSGETAAQGVKVVFYGDPGTTDPSKALGEALIEEIAPNSVAEAVLDYNLKAGEEDREFHPAFEPYLKGSLQRVPRD